MATIKPPLLKHVTNPLTNERGYKGKDMPLVTWDVAGGADWVEILCQPKALGSGRWAALETFSFPTLADDRGLCDEGGDAGGLAALPAGDHRRGHRRQLRRRARRSPSKATMRPVGSTNPEPDPRRDGGAPAATR